MRGYFIDERKGHAMPYRVYFQHRSGVAEYIRAFKLLASAERFCTQMNREA